MTIDSDFANLKFNAEKGNELSFASFQSGLSSYVGVENPEGNARLQVISSVGKSRIRFKEQNHAEEAADSSYHSLGVKGWKLLFSSDKLLSGGSSELNASMVSWISRQHVADNGGYIGDMQIDAGFYGFDLEGVHSQELSKGMEVKPSILLGIRWYDWNGNASHAMLLNGGVSFASTFGLRIEGASFMEVSQFDKVQRIGLSGTIEYDYGYDELGGLFSLNSNWAQSSKSGGYLMAGDSFQAGNFGYGGREDNVSIISKLGYGIRVWDGSGILSPYIGIDMDGNGVEKMLFGKNVSNKDTGLELKLEVSRNALDSAQVEESVSIGGSIKWH